MKKYIGIKMVAAEKAFKVGDKIYSNENNEIDAFMLADGEVAQMGYAEQVEQERKMEENKEKEHSTPQCTPQCDLCCRVCGKVHEIFADVDYSQ